MKLPEWFYRDLASAINWQRQMVIMSCTMDMQSSLSALDTCTVKICVTLQKLDPLFDADEFYIASGFTDFEKRKK